MADDGESNADTGPVTSFASLAAEGDLLYKQGEMKKAIETFSKVESIINTVIASTNIDNDTHRSTSRHYINDQQINMSS